MGGPQRSPRANGSAGGRRASGPCGWGEDSSFQRRRGLTVKLMVGTFVDTPGIFSVPTRAADAPQSYNAGWPSAAACCLIACGSAAEVAMDVQCYHTCSPERFPDRCICSSCDPHAGCIEPSCLFDSRP